MKPEVKSRKSWGEREKVAGLILAISASSFIGAELLLLNYIRITWEIQVVVVIGLVLGGLIGFGNVKVGSIILTIIGFLLLAFGILYTYTSNPLFFLYTPWFHLWGYGFSFEGVLSLISALLFLDSARREI